MPHELARYLVLEKLSLRRPNDPRLREYDVGCEVSFEGKPGPALLPLNGAARANKLRALIAGPGPHRPVEPLRQARGLGFTGHDVGAARAFVQDFIAVETARQTTASSPLISSTQEH
jgi:hypothetical protein